MIASLLEVFSGQMAILSSTGEVIECNTAFEGALALGSPLSLASDGHLMFSEESDQRAFQSALTRKHAVAFCTTDLCASPMVVTIRPLKSANPTEQDLMLMGIATGEPQSPSLGFLRSRYGLTVAETRVTELVVRGLLLNEVADRIGISKITARNQLTSAMSKLGVKRQVQLVALVMNMFPRWSNA